MTSASCLNECSNALIMVLRPATKHRGRETENECEIAKKKRKRKYMDDTQKSVCENSIRYGRIGNWQLCCDLLLALAQQHLTNHD